MNEFDSIEWLQTKLAEAKHNKVNIDGAILLLEDRLREVTAGVEQTPDEIATDAMRRLSKVDKAKIISKDPVLSPYITSLKIAMFDFENLAKKIQKNSDKLDGCSRHMFPKFSLNAVTTSRWDHRVECMNCGGGMRLSEIVVYAKGYVAAHGNPDDILPGLFG